MSFMQFLPLQKPDRPCKFAGCEQGPENTRKVFTPSRQAPNTEYCCAFCRDENNNIRQRRKYLKDKLRHG